MVKVTVPYNKHPNFVVRQEQPYNGGPPLRLLRQHFVTPAGLFYVRTHGSVPAVDASGYRLRVHGMVRRELELTLEDVQTRFERVTLTATLQCAGNRRGELMTVRAIPGEVAWGAEAIGNAVWEGARLRDVLTEAGLDEAATRGAATRGAATRGAAANGATALHVAFTSVDEDEVEREGRRFGFGGSIPLEKALGSEVLLAYRMNGEPLPPVHGFPLRVVVPGYIGARSVKWLGGIAVQDGPSDNFFQARAYRLFPPDVHTEHDAGALPANGREGVMLGDVGINAVICSPQEGEVLAAGPVTVQGYATCGGSRTVRAVELSADGGRTWSAARLGEQANPWAWCHWEGVIDLAPGENQLAVRAVDSDGNGQPERAAQVWNYKGYMNNAWHRVQVTAY